MVFAEDQSTSVCDFTRSLSDGTLAAVEVTSARDSIELETVAAIDSRRHGGHTIKAELCTKSWRIRPRPGASIRLIRMEVDAALAAVEAAGFDSFGPGATPDHDVVRHAADGLGIFFANVVDDVGAGRLITIAPPMGGSFVGGALVHHAFLGAAERADNRAKLGGSGATERHLAVYVDPANHRVWVPLVDLGPPAEVVPLPWEVTHAWVFSESRRQDHYVVWMVRAGCSWEPTEIGPLHLPAARTPANTAMELSAPMST
jgi:hypothetical protein